MLLLQVIIISEHLVHDMLQNHLFSLSDPDMLHVFNVLG
jgi:hypothetical protein